MKRPFLALFAGLAALSSSPVFSEQVQNLLEAEVPVVSQGDEARHAGFVEAFQAVLVKLSGRSEAARQPGMAEAVNAPERFVEQFRFTAKPGATTPSLWVRFDRRAMEELLRDKGLPLWGSNRPLLIAWLAVEEKGRHSLIGTADAGPIAAALRSAAERRAVPAHLPAVDGTDLAAVRPEQVFVGAVEPVLTASMRYQAQAALTGAFSREGEQWRVRWALHRDGVVLRQWEALGAPEAVVDAGIDVGTDELARSFAAPVDVPFDGLLAVQVSGVTNLEDFLRVSTYLRNLTGVTSVQPAEVTADQVVLSVAFQGSAQGLARALASGELLAAAPVSPPATELSYRLLK